MEKMNLDYQLFLQRENDFYHQPFSNENDFYNAIQHGDLRYIEECKRKYGIKQDDNESGDGKGILSKDKVRNERYHFIINVAIITRYCILGGLSQEEAYTLSDLYIQHADEVKSIEGLRILNDKMVHEFTCKMREHRTRYCQCLMCFLAKSFYQFVSKKVWNDTKYV